MESSRNQSYYCHSGRIQRLGALDISPHIYHCISYIGDDSPRTPPLMDQVVQIFNSYIAVDGL